MSWETEEAAAPDEDWHAALKDAPVITLHRRQLFCTCPRDRDTQALHMMMVIYITVPPPSPPSLHASANILTHTGRMRNAEERCHLARVANYLEAAFLIKFNLTSRPSPFPSSSNCLCEAPQNFASVRQLVNQSILCICMYMYISLAIDSPRQLSTRKAIFPIFCDFCDFHIFTLSTTCD